MSPAEPATCNHTLLCYFQQHRICFSLFININIHTRTTLVPSVHKKMIVRALVTVHRKQFNNLRVTVPEMTV